jgi:hypothetical protein
MGMASSLPWLYIPTAHTSLDEIAATPVSLFARVPMLGLVITVQEVPSQCKVSV